MKLYLFILGLFIFPPAVFAQEAYNFYVSSTGNDANPGTLDAPKKTVAGLNEAIRSVPDSQQLKTALRSGDVFNGTLQSNTVIHAATYYPAGGKNFAIMKGSEMVGASWARVPGNGNGNVYSITIPVNGFMGAGINGIGQYSFVYVFEIDKQQERIAPLTARRMLSFVSGIATVETTPGSFFEPVVYNSSGITLYIHTGNSLSPNNNPRYRYEICTQARGINADRQNGNSFERLWLTGYGAGNGMISSGGNSSFDRVIFGPGAAAHHVALKSGSIDNALFLPGPKNTNGSAVVFYDVQGEWRRNQLKNSIFLDIKYPIYSHVSNGSNYSSLVVDNVIAFGTTGDAYGFFECANTDSVVMDRVYCDNYLYGYHFGSSQYVNIRNSIFKDALEAVGFPDLAINATINNTLMRIKGNNRIAGVVTSHGSKVILSNSIIHIKNQQSTANPLSGFFINGSRSANGIINAQGNIFICDVPDDNYILAAFTNRTSSGLQQNDFWDNNVYILLNGNKLVWGERYNTTGGYIEINSFDSWKRITGQDRNSIFLDLRGDIRGLKAVFADPDNGDYSLANTIEGNRIRQMRAGMIAPVTCFVKKPSYEEAAKIIINNGVLTANACRNPCTQTNIRIDNHISTGLAENKKIVINWDIADETQVDHYEIMRSTGNSGYTSIGSVPAETNYNYTFTDSNVMAGILYRYSIGLVTKNNQKCFSAVSSVQTENGRAVQIFPNPSSGKVFIGLNDYTGPVTVKIYNVMGRKIYEKKMTAYYGQPLQADVSFAVKGFYWMHVQTDIVDNKQGFVLQ